MPSGKAMGWESGLSIGWTNTRVAPPRRERNATHRLSGEIRLSDSSFGVVANGRDSR